MLSHPRWLAGLAGAALAVAPVSALTAKAGKAPMVYTITLQQMKFGATPTTLHVGDIVEWVNNDIFLHSATAKDKSFDVELKPKAHVRTVMTRMGTIAFSCRYHPGMTGALVVAK